MEYVIINKSKYRQLLHAQYLVKHLEENNVLDDTAYMSDSDLDTVCCEINHQIYLQVSLTRDILETNTKVLSTQFEEVVHGAN